VFSAFDLIWRSMCLVSLLLGDLLADFAGIRAVCCTGGALLAVAGVAGFTLARLPGNPGHDQRRARRAWRARYKPAPTA